MRLPFGIGGRPLWRLRVAVSLLVLVAVIVSGPASIFAEAQQKELARAQVEKLPAADVMFRILDSTLPAGQPGVTHAHASGFDYAVEGSHVLTVRGKEHIVNPGQATWVGEGEQHTHAGLSGAGMRFWFFAVRPASNRGVPPGWPHPVRRIRSESDTFQVASPGPYNLVLSEIRLAPGDTIGPLSKNGTVGVSVVDGQVSLGEQAIAAEALVIQAPGDTRVLRNTGTGPAHMLALAILPAAAPQQLPRTGEPTAPTHMLLAVGGLLLVFGLAISKRRRTVTR